MTVRTKTPVVVGVVAVMTAAVVLVGGVSGAGGATGSVQALWVIRDLGTLGGKSSEAVGINNRGEVAGNSEARGSYMHAFVWEREKMHDLGTLGGPSSQAAGDAEHGGHAINDGGEVVGSSLASRKDSSTSEHAFLWKDGRLRDLGTLGGLQSRAVAVNQKGWIIGESEVKRNQHSGWPYGDKRGFVWNDGRMRSLSLGGTDSWPDAINARGQVIGWSQLKERDSRGHTIYHAFLWDGGQIRDLGRPGVQVMNDRGQIFRSAGRSWSLWQDDHTAASGRLALPIRSFTPTAMNERTQVVGYCTTKGAAGHPCLWEAGSVRILGSMRGSTIGRALDISERAEIVGRMKAGSPGHPNDRAFVWANGTIHDLGTLGGDSSSAVAIDDRAEIAGWSTTRRGYRHAVLWTLKPG